MRWPVALLGVMLASGLLWLERSDLGYLFSPRQPIQLGDESGYAFDRLTSNRYAEIHGLPAENAAYSRRGDTVYVVLALQNTPILVRRGALPTEDWVPNRPPPRPDPHPFGARGRLLAREDASGYELAFEMLAHDVVAKDGQSWILLEGERPGADVRTAVASGLLAAFALVNLWLVARDLLLARVRPTIARASH